MIYIQLIEPYIDVLEKPYAITEITKHYRNFFYGILVINRGFNKDTANQVLNEGNADLVSFAKLYITDLDLVDRSKGMLL